MAERNEFEDLLQAQLAPLRGRFKEVGIRLAAPEGADVVPGEALLDRATLAAHVARFGERIGTANQRIAGVHWLGQLGYAVLPPIELAMTRAGIGLDASLSNIGVIQTNNQPTEVLLRDPAGTVVLAERYAGAIPAGSIGRPVATAEELRAFVLDRLFGRTFGPLVELIHDLTGVSRQVLWGQVAYEADLFYQQLVRAEPEARTAAWEEDRAALFERREWSVAPGPSPLHGPTRVVTLLDPATGAANTRTLRSVCCLIYHVPNARMCGACPLAPKKELVLDKQATAPERRAARREAAAAVSNPGPAGAR
jgi:hypothetical protein